VERIARSGIPEADPDLHHTSLAMVRIKRNAGPLARPGV